MPIETNLYLCLFLLCASGALSAPLRRARIHPAAAGFVCLGAMFFSVFEEVQLLPRLYAGAGGCFFPLAAGVLLLAQGPNGMRRFLTVFILLCALIGFLTGNLASDLTDLWFHGVPWLCALAVVLSAVLFTQNAHDALLCAFLGYYGAGFLQYLFVVLPQKGVSLSLGAGADALPCALVGPVTLLLCELLSAVLCWHKKRTAEKAQPSLLKTPAPEEPWQPKQQVL